MNSQKPSRLSQAAAWPFKGLVYLYRWLISPLLPPSCRYAPSCSEYALEALNRHGVFVGGWYTLKRLGRCQPWGGEGYDPVPGTDHDHDHRHDHHHDHVNIDQHDHKSAEIPFANHSH